LEPDGGGSLVYGDGTSLNADGGGCFPSSLNADGGVPMTLTDVAGVRA